MNVFQPSYWCGTKPDHSLNYVNTHTGGRTMFFEDEPVDVVAGIQIKGLSKKFTAKGMVKVDQLLHNLDLAI